MINSQQNWLDYGPSSLLRKKATSVAFFLFYGVGLTSFGSSGKNRTSYPPDADTGSPDSHLIVIGIVCYW